MNIWIFTCKTYLDITTLADLLRLMFTQLSCQSPWLITVGGMIVILPIPSKRQKDSERVLSMFFALGSWPSAICWTIHEPRLNDHQQSWTIDLTSTNNSVTIDWHSLNILQPFINHSLTFVNHSLVTLSIPSPFLHRSAIHPGGAAMLIASMPAPAYAGGMFPGHGKSTWTVGVVEKPKVEPKF